jgi:transposase InsO family protein
MQRHGIQAKGRRRFKVTTDSRHDLPIAPNLLDRQFAVRISAQRDRRFRHRDRSFRANVTDAGFGSS